MTRTDISYRTIYIDGIFSPKYEIYIYMCFILTKFCYKKQILKRDEIKVLHYIVNGKKYIRPSENLAKWEYLDAIIDNMFEDEVFYLY